MRSEDFSESVNRRQITTIPKVTYAALGIAAYYTHYMCQPLKSAKALAIKSIGGEDIDGSSFCKFGVCPMLCFSKYSCTICSIQARSVCGKDFVSAFS